MDTLWPMTSHKTISLLG